MQRLEREECVSSERRGESPGCERALTPMVYGVLQRGAAAARRAAHAQARGGPRRRRRRAGDAHAPQPGRVRRARAAALPAGDGCRAPRRLRLLPARSLREVAPRLPLRSVQPVAKRPWCLCCAV